jgi:hypothetical protein
MNRAAFCYLVAFRISAMFHCLGSALFSGGGLWLT